ncbi:hypothetical protein DOTSEDRAFT_27409 [Dothistroma septosporum NZE10]|uniref:Uncharacterized protein n=1 Tax=Dothistroma septosporum (strain NZE10 / CBS 128990) TaxID=675120 RepID=N1PFC8_DOTSN|nr:hypothetical protein DOTSEDRAFT_27409 [Dothistroma septosporum NZE10]
MSARNMNEIQGRIQGMAQELRDMIFDFVLTVDMPDDNNITIDEDYEPPVQLQINSATRKSIGQRYYTHTIFTFLNFYDGEALCMSWIDSLSPENQQQLNQVRLAYPRPHRISDYIGTPFQQLRHLYMSMYRVSYYLSRDVKFKVARMGELLHVNVERTRRTGQREVLWLPVGIPGVGREDMWKYVVAVVLEDAEV